MSGLPIDAATVGVLETRRKRPAAVRAPRAPGIVTPMIDNLTLVHAAKGRAVGVRNWFAD